MLGAVARKLFGSANDRRIRGYQPRVAAINALEGSARAFALRLWAPLLATRPGGDPALATTSRRCSRCSRSPARTPRRRRRNLPPWRP